MGYDDAEGHGHRHPFFLIPTLFTGHKQGLHSVFPSFSPTPAVLA